MKLKYGLIGALTLLLPLAHAQPPLGPGIPSGPGSQVETNIYPTLPTLPTPPAATQTPNRTALLEPQVPRNDDPVVAIPIDPVNIDHCPPEAPIRIDSTTCINQAMLDIIEAGTPVTIDPDGTVTIGNDYTYDYAGGGFEYDPATDPCNPNIDVMLQEAAVFGSQLTRGIVNQQMDYPETDPIHAVNNPQSDGYGGSCTIELITIDISDIIGSDPLQSLEDIIAIINAIAALDIDGLFNLACNVINSIFGDLIGDLLDGFDPDNPQTPFEQFIAQLVPGFVASLNAYATYGSDPQPTTAEIDGVVTGSSLLVSFIPDVGYVYMALLSSGNTMVVGISATPLAPGDATAQ